jgi:hypothetical protein
MTIRRIAARPERNNQGLWISVSFGVRGPIVGVPLSARGHWLLPDAGFLWSSSHWRIVGSS